MSKFVTIRITPKGTDVFAKIMEVVRGKYGGGFVCVREEAGEENEHYHIHMCPNGSITQLRDAINRSLKGEANGNKFKSIKACDLKMLNYICKGSSKHPMPKGDFPDVVEKYGLFYTDERIEKAYNDYWAESVAIKETRDVTFPIECENYMKLNEMAFTIPNAVRAVVKLTIQKHKPINNFYVEGVAKYIVAKNDRTYQEALIASIVRRCQGTE